MRLLLALCAALLLAACSTVPKPPGPPPLPSVRLKEVRDLLAAGSYLQGLEAVDALRRDGTTGIAAGDLDTLQKQAVESLSTAFQGSVAGKSYSNALRLLDSAAAAGAPSIVGTWTRESLLRDLAAAQDAGGDLVLSLLTRLRILSSQGVTDADYGAAMAAAVKLDNRAVIRSVAAAMKSRGLEVPAAAAEAGAAPSFPTMISGTVTILVNKGIKLQNGVGYPDSVIGSGFFIDKRGYILTNHHVIQSEVDPKYEGYSRLSVRLSESPAGERIPARVVGYDTTFDLALIKIETTPGYTFGGSGGETVVPGDRIFAIGSPAGLEKTLTSGIVSATGRRLLQVGDSIQVDVPLNPGNSGGPLLNEKGDLIGVVFAGLQQFEGLNFAVPYALVEKALPGLYKGGAVVHPWMGMALSETDAGLEVVYVVPDEPAAGAGIRAGDIVEALDGVHYAKLADMQDAVLRHDAVTLVRVGIRRGAAHLEALVCLSARPEEPIQVALKRDARDNVLYPLFGMQLQNVGTFLWKGDYIVKRVTRGSVADDSGISVDDPLTIQDWQVDADKGYAILQVVIKKRRAGFVESAIQIGSWLETDNFT